MFAVFVDRFFRDEKAQSHEASRVARLPTIIMSKMCVFSKECETKSSQATANEEERKHIGAKSSHMMIFEFDGIALDRCPKELAVCECAR